MDTSQSLENAAYALAEEIRDGKWDHLSDLKQKPVPACTEIIDELRRRCPGHMLEQYRRAIADGMFESR